VKNDVLQIGPQLVQEKMHCASNLIKIEAQIFPYMQSTWPPNVSHCLLPRRPLANMPQLYDVIFTKIYHFYCVWWWWL